jgi:hypothetical protein
LEQSLFACLGEAYDSNLHGSILFLKKSERSFTGLDKYHRMKVVGKLIGGKREPDTRAVKRTPLKGVFFSMPLDGTVKSPG